MADLSLFATKDNADEGVILPVKIEGKKLPIAIKVYGSDSDVVKDFERERIRKIGLGKGGKTDIDEDTVEELLDSQDEGVLVRIGGVYAYDWNKSEVIDETVTLGNKEIKCDKKSYKFLIEKIPAIKDWVTEVSNERTNFLSEGKKN